MWQSEVLRCCFICIFSVTEADKCPECSSWFCERTTVNMCPHIRDAGTERPLLDVLDHTPSVEVPIICWELIQSLYSSLQCLKGPRGRHWVLITVWILLVVAVSREMSPEHIDSNTKLQRQGVVEPQGWSQTGRGALLYTAKLSLQCLVSSLFSFIIN